MHFYFYFLFSSFFFSFSSSLRNAHHEIVRNNYIKAYVMWFDLILWLWTRKWKKRREKKVQTASLWKWMEQFEIFMCCTFASVVLQAIPSKSFRITALYYKCEITDYYIQNEIAYCIPSNALISFLLYAYVVSLLFRSFRRWDDGCRSLSLSLCDAREKKLHAVINGFFFCLCVCE